MACSQPWTLWATWGWTLLCSSWCLHYVLPDICYWLWYIAIKVCDSNGVHRLLLHGFKSKNRDSSLSKNIVSSTLPADCCDLNFCGWGELECLCLHACWFSCVQKVKSHRIVLHSPLHRCIILSRVLLQMLEHWALTGNRLCDIQDTIQLHVLLMLIFISIWWEMNELHLSSFTTFRTCTLSELVTLWAFSVHNMSIVCCLSCSKYTALIHHRCLWYTCCATDSKICLWIWAGWHTSTPGNCISALWSCLDRFTTSCNI